METRVHIIGGKNHGKTTLLEELVVEFRSRGLRVGTIKHTHHHHELDTPGKDSHRHREAGAAVIGILSPSMSAIFRPTEKSDANEPRDPEQRYESLAPAFARCDVVLVEGDVRTTAPRVEVWRAERDAAPLANRGVDVVAVVTDDAIDVQAPVLPRADVTAVADFIWKLATRSSA